MCKRWHVTRAQVRSKPYITAHLLRDTRQDQTPQHSHQHVTQASTLNKVVLYKISAPAHNHAVVEGAQAFLPDAVHTCTQACFLINHSSSQHCVDMHEQPQPQGQTTLACVYLTFCPAAAAARSSSIGGAGLAPKPCPSSVDNSRSQPGTENSSSGGEAGAGETRRST